MTPVYICRMKRTAIGRYGGALANMRPDDLAARVIDAVCGGQGLPIDEVVLGCANQAGEDNRNVARMAVLLSSLPETVPAVTLNRLCASGLDAVIHGARSIAVGAQDLVIAGGVESMSRAPFVMPKAGAAFSRNAEIHDTTIGWRFVNEQIAKRCGIESMPETAENIAAEKNISRVDQDAFALLSQQRYDAAWHAADIVPVAVGGAKGQPGMVSTDEHPRSTTLEKLAALPAPFRKGGTVTAGNASGVNDGAAALLLASDKAVKRFNLSPLARITHAASAGVAPRLMGLGPVAALERLQAQNGREARDYDVIELNEAFAAQVLGCTRAWGLPDGAENLNAKGGAISMGHPLGMSGARIAGTAARRLHESGGKSALVTLCVGVGQGVAMCLERA
ncbi:MAG: acetyl-CoA C-acyltransferase [Alphaproteobacteria bacterium]|nr:acetyl-CoA C-acyltransferase [Alphaproteobacteria bacterium]